MEKKIVLEMMFDSKDIKIFINNEEKLIIRSGARKLNANDLYNLLDYGKGDFYSVKVINSGNVDKKVIDFFADLLKEITDKLNKIRDCQ